MAEKVSPDLEDLLSKVDKTPLGEDDTFDVYKMLKPVATEWKFIGLALRLKRSTLNEIEKAHPNSPSDCLLDVLTDWLQKNYDIRKIGEPTWQKIVEVVANEAAGGNKALAMKIAKEHPHVGTSLAEESEPMQKVDSDAVHDRETVETEDRGSRGTCQLQVSSGETIPDTSLGGGADGSCVDNSNKSASVPSPESLPNAVEVLHRHAIKGYPNPVPKVTLFQYLDMKALSDSEKADLSGRLYEEFEEITVAFASLVTKTEQSLNLRNISVKTLVGVLCGLGAFRSTLRLPKKPLLMERMDEMRRASDIGDIFYILQEYCSFFSYKIIEHVINMLGSKDDHEQLANYRQKFDEYCKRGIFECPSYSVHQPKHAEMVMKFQSNGQEWNMIHLDKLHSTISKIIQVSDYTLRLRTVEEGCFQLRYQLPHFVAPLIFPLSVEQEAAMLAEGVAYISCDWSEHHLEFFIKDPATLKDEGDKFLEIESIDEALSKYSHALELHELLQHRREESLQMKSTLQIIELHANTAYACLQLLRYKEALRHAKECVALDSKFTKGYLLSAKALKRMALTQRKGNERDLQDAVSYFLEHFRRTLADDEDLALESMCQAIVLGVKNTKCRAMIQEYKLHQSFATKLLHKLISNEMSEAVHSRFLLNDMPRVVAPRVVAPRVVAPSPMFNASKVQVSQLLSKADVDHELLQSMVKAGMTINVSDLQVAVTLLPDKNGHLIKFIATQSHANRDNLTSAFLVAAEARKINLAACLIQCGAEPDIEEVKTLIESGDTPHHIFIKYIAGSPDCSTSYRTELLKQAFKLASNEDPDNSISHILASGSVQASEIDLEQLFHSYPCLLQNPGLIKQLLDVGVTVESIGPLSEVMKHNMDPISRNYLVCLLLEHGANISDLCSPETTPLHVAVKLALQSGDTKVIGLTAESFPFPKNGRLTDKQGDTPFHSAVKRKATKDIRLKVCTSLSQCHLDPTVRDKKKRRAIDYLQEHDECFLILKTAAETFTGIKPKKKPLKSKIQVTEPTPDTKQNLKSSSIVSAPSDPRSTKQDVTTTIAPLYDQTSSVSPVPTLSLESAQHRSDVPPSADASTSMSDEEEMPVTEQQTQPTLSLNSLDYEVDECDETEVYSPPTPPLRWIKQITVADKARKVGLSIHELLHEYMVMLKQKNAKYFERTYVETMESDSDYSDDEIVSEISDITRSSGASTESGYITGEADNVVTQDQPEPIQKMFPIPEEVGVNSVSYTNVTTPEAVCSTKLPPIPKEQLSSEAKVFQLISTEDWVWEVECTRKVLRVLKHRKTPEVLRKVAIHAIQEIACTKSEHQWSRYRIKSVSQLHLYQKNIAKNACILWEKTEQFSPRNTSDPRKPEYTDVVRLWDIANLKKVPHITATIIQQARKSKEVKHLHQGASSQAISPAISTYPDGKPITSSLHASPPLSMPVFHELSSAAATKLYSGGSNYDLPLKLSSEEHKIITMEDEAPIMLLGRSGTGKTTCCLYRLWNHFKSSQQPIHQVFLTKNPHLCAQVKKWFYKLVALHDYVDHLPFRKSEVPHKLSEIQNFAYPLFLTSQEFLFHLDCTLEGKPFLPESRKILSEHRASDDDSHVLHNHEDEVASPKSQSVPFEEVTAAIFEDKIWKNIKTKKDLQKLHKQGDIDPLRVWMDIKSFIKGSARALLNDDGELSEEQYKALGWKMASNFPDTECRSDVYKLYDAYKTYCQNERFETRLYDECELEHDLFKRLKQGKKRDWIIHNFYIDEVQDFTQAELLLVLNCCENPNNVFFAGDTAQSIMRDVAFRFEDLHSQFKNFQEAVKGVHEPARHSLKVNYRSHAGILNLARSVLKLLEEYFRKSFDVLPEDEGWIGGPSPVLIDSDQEDELVLLLASSAGKHSHIEFGHHQAIIVQTPESKKNLPDSIKESGMVFTVFEAKGLEFDDVLLYNFFSDSRVGVDEWTLATWYLEKYSHSIKQDHDCMFQKPRIRKTEEKIMESKSLNAELKLLYTAITRAKQKLWIYDQSDKRGPVFHYWERNGLVEIIGPSQGHQRLEFAVASTPQQWKAQGDYMKKREMWKHAMQCYHKAGQLDLEKEVYALYLEQKAQKDKDPELKLRVALAFLESDELRHDVRFLHRVAEHLMEAQKLSEAAWLFEMLSEDDKAVTAFHRLKDYKNSSRVREKFGKYDAAIHELSKESKLEAVRKAHEYEVQGIPLSETCNDLAVKFATPYAKQQPTRHLFKQLLAYVSEHVLHILLLKYAELYDDAYKLHIKCDEQGKALRLAEAQGWYKRAIKLASKKKKSEIVLQKARAQLKTHQCVDKSVIFELKKLVQFGQHEPLIQINASLLLARSTQDHRDIETAVELSRIHQSLPSEVEALYFLNTFYKPIPNEGDSSVKSRCRQLVAVRNLISLTNKAKRLIFLLKDQDDNMIMKCEGLLELRVEDEHYRNNMEWFLTLNLPKQQIEKSEVQKNDMAEGRFYLLPNYNQDIWICKFEKKDPLKDLDGMCLIEKTKAHTEILAHFCEYFQSSVTDLYKWTIGTSLYRLALRGPLTSTAWMQPSDDLEAYIQACTIIMKSSECDTLIIKVRRSMHEYLRPFTWDQHPEIQTALLRLYSLQSSVYFQLNSDCLASLQNERKLVNDYTRKEENCIKEPNDANQLLRVWQECNVLGFNLNERLMQYTFKERATCHLLIQWLNICKSIKKPSQVLETCRTILMEFLPETITKGNISPRNLADVVCVAATAIIAIAQHSEYIQFSSSDWLPTLFVLPLAYQSTIQVFDHLNCQAKGSPLLVACKSLVDVTRRPHAQCHSKYLNVESLQLTAVDSLDSALELLVEPQSEQQCHALLHQVLNSEQSLRNDSARACLILTLTLFINATITNSPKFHRYHRAILSTFPEQWPQGKHWNHVRVAVGMFRDAANLRKVCEALHHLIKGLCEGPTDTLGYLSRDHTGKTIFVPLSRENYPQKPLPSQTLCSVCGIPLLAETSVKPTASPQGEKSTSLESYHIHIKSESHHKKLLAYKKFRGKLHLSYRPLRKELSTITQEVQSVSHDARLSELEDSCSWELGLREISDMADEIEHLIKVARKQLVTASASNSAQPQQNVTETDSFAAKVKEGTV